MIRMFLLLAVVTFIACENEQEQDPRISRIEQLEAKLSEDVSRDTSLVKELTTAYISYADENPQDSLSPWYLIRAADILKEIRMEQLRAVNLYARVHQDYPDHTMAAKSVFMIGFIFDEKYNDQERARKSYTYFLNNYPNHPLAEDARNLLTLLQDSTDDLEQVKQWMEQSKRDTLNNGSK